MKKRSLFIVVAMVLLLAVVLGMGGATFAKYYSDLSIAPQSATVAKWGYIINVTDGVLFGTEYDVDGTVQDGGLAIVSNSSSNVLAPGANDSMTFTLSGTAEVMSEFSITATGTDISLAKNGMDTYYPLEWTVTKDGVDVVAPGSTLADVLAYFNANTFDEAVAANDTPDLNGTYVISYEWPFEVDTTTNGYDTLLGQKAANVAISSDYTANIEASFGLTITVTQVEPDGN
jgi:hypothetical protein